MKNGKYIEYGNTFYYKDDKIHRLDGPAAENINGTKVWYKGGKYHRLDGPAIENADGEKHWYKDGLRHREDGPAVEFASGLKLWYYNNKKINCSSQEEFEKLLKLKIFW